MARYNALEDEEELYEPFQAEVPVRRGTGPIGARETFRFVLDPKTEAVTILDDEGRDYQLINPLEYPRDKWAREELFDMWFGDTRHVLVWATSFEDALEESASWLYDKGFKGYFVDDEQLKELFEEAMEELGEQADEEEAQEKATADLTYTEAGYITSYEWGGQEAYQGLVQAALYASMIEYAEQYGEED